METQTPTNHIDYGKIYELLAHEFCQRRTCSRKRNLSREQFFGDCSNLLLPRNRLVDIISLVDLAQDMTHTRPQKTHACLCAACHLSRLSSHIPNTNLVNEHRDAFGCYERIHFVRWILYVSCNVIHFQLSDCQTRIELPNVIVSEGIRSLFFRCVCAKKNRSVT